jgi:hypothetical protein
MIETKTKESWSAYTVNDAITLYIKYSTKPAAREHGKGALVWTFSFTSDQLNELRKLRVERKVHVALVCGQRMIDVGSMHICFMDPEEVDECIDLYSDMQQAISVKYETGRKNLRVWGTKNTAKNLIQVSRGRLGRWRIPGS